ncbi:MAG TPA: TatD family hydrolase [Aeromicrobium sp.]|nr:TatD family hydrolase [Aeromicrobium sp.]
MTSDQMTWPDAPEPLPFPVVDNHCHLDHRVKGGQRIEPAEAIARAAAVGVTRIVQVGTDVESSRWAVEAAKQFPSVVAAVALHPNDAPRLGEDYEPAFASIAELAADPHVRAVGETGLDHFRTGPDGQGAQEQSFRDHIRLAKELDRTLVIHDRDAHADILRVLDDEGIPARTVMHCFSGNGDFAQACVERGAYLSFAGTVTFKNAENVREGLRTAPRDRILVETDAPFLTPEPFRGRPNASFLIPLTVRFMAGIVGDSVEELCRNIRQNTEHAFGGPWPEWV